MTDQLIIDRCAVCGRPDGYRGWKILRLRQTDNKGLVFVHAEHSLTTIAKSGFAIRFGGKLLTPD